MRRLGRTAALAAAVCGALAISTRAEDDWIDPSARAPEVVPGGGGGIVLEPAGSFGVGGGGGYSIDVSRGDGTLAVGGRNGDVVLMRAEKSDADKLIRLRPYSNAVESLSLSPDGKRMVTGALEGQVIVWDVVAGRPLRGFPGGTACAWSPDGATVAQSGEDRHDALLRDAATLDVRVTCKIDDDDRAIERIRFAPDSKTVAVSTAAGTAYVFDCATGARKSRISLAPGEPVYGLAILPDGRLCAAARNGVLRIGDHAVAGFGGVCALAASPDGKLLAVGDHKTGTLDSVDTTTLTVTKLAEPGSDPWIGAVAFSASGQSVYWIADGGPLRTLELAAGGVPRERDVLDLTTDELSSVAISPDGAEVAAASRHGLSFGHVSKTGTHAFVQAVPVTGPAAYRVVAPAAKGAEIAVITGHDVSVWNAGECKILRTLGAPHPEIGDSLRGAWSSPDGSKVLVGSHFAAPHMVSLADAESAELPTRFQHPLDAAWSPDGALLALAMVGGHHGEFQTAAIGRVDALGVVLEKPLVERSGFGREDRRGPPRSVAFSPSGRRLVLCEGGDVVELDAATRKELRRTAADVDWFRFIDEDHALVQTDDGIAAWDVAKAAATPLLRGGDLRELALSRDGSVFAAGSRWTVFVYRVKLGN